jgi:hypothetical protein
MKITDLNGKDIEITDLTLAIMQADDFRHYEIGGVDAIAYNRKQKEYWEDFYGKLLELENLNS